MRGGKNGFFEVIIVLVVLVVAGAVGFFVYQNGQPKEETKHSNPEKVVTAFFEAVQNKNKNAARSLISSSANKESFRSTFEDDPNIESLYTKDFSFLITDSKTDSNSYTAYINVDLTIGEQTVKTLMILEKGEAEKWLITESQTVATSDKIPSFAQIIPRPDAFYGALILAGGPVELYLKSPDGIYAGFDPQSNSLIETTDLYYDNQIDGIRSFAVTDMIGTWELKVVGIGDGEYQLLARIVETFKDATVDGNISIGVVDTYLLRYPNDNDKPIEIIFVE